MTKEEIMLSVEQITSIAESNASRRPMQSADAARPRVPVYRLQLRPVGARYMEVEFDAPLGFAAGHKWPAQYITMGAGEQVSPRYIVLANAPCAKRWRCLITRDSSLGEAFGDDLADPTLDVHVSAPEGRGFAIEEVVHDAHKPLVLLTTGSGVATMHSVIEWVTRENPSKLADIHLYYGEQQEDSIAYEHKIKEWRSRGVHVTMAYDAPLDDAYPWRYVQEPLLARGGDALFDRAMFLMSGSPAMLHFATRALLERGVSPEQVLLNV